MWGIGIKKKKTLCELHTKEGRQQTDLDDYFAHIKFRKNRSDGSKM